MYQNTQTSGINLELDEAITKAHLDRYARRRFVAFATMIFILTLATSVRANDGKRLTEKPNVIFILADDLGWSDTTLFQTTRFYKTPNIERLAARGMTFNRAYASSPLCSPTRASILTGLSPARIGITAPVCHTPRIALNASASKTAPPSVKATTPLSATRLDTKYYTLGEMFRDNGYATSHFGKWHLGAEPYSPLQHGFDVDIPHWPGPGPAGSYVAPWKFPDFDPNVPTEHIEDRMANEAVAFMEKNKDRPFFLNYWMFSVHAPFDAKKQLIKKYSDSVDPTDHQKSPTYAAMIESMDDAVGTLLDTLDRLKISDKTIIIFASDNGGNMYNQVDGTTATSNFPLRGGKATMYEGGVRGPAVVIVPDLVAKGSRSHTMIQSGDFYPTILELLKIEPKANQQFDGVSIVPTFTGKPIARDAIFTYFPHGPKVPDWLPPSVSVHKDDWKLIRIFHGGKEGAHRWKLFNLKEDIGEKQNLAGKKPGLVRELDGLITEFLNDTNATLPLPNPNFDNSKYRIELEGKADLKGSNRSKKQRTPKRSNGKIVAGWKPSSDCQLAINKSGLQIQSLGGDPFVSFDFPKTINGKNFQLQFDLISNSSGVGHVFWKEKLARPFNKNERTSFTPIHNGKSKRYTIRFATNESLAAIRIDPSTQKGEIELINPKLIDGEGRVIYEWKFVAKQ